MLHIASIFAKPVLDKFGVTDEAKERFVALQKAVTGDTGTAWIPLSRPSATLDFSTHTQTQSDTFNTGSIESKDGPVTWCEFVWNSDQIIKDCILHKVSWRFYSNKLICLEVCASKDDKGLDGSDLIGHRLELRDRSGFLIGIWAAAFLIVKDTDRRSFQTSAEDDHKVLGLHFNMLADAQTGLSFRI
ncbi:hypothetical protein [Roseibium sp.]|uniref:hypothetical protein n=1 Tax=Roseibium sp. TaxID=1936156 RepID=UPI003BACE798